MLRRTPTGLFQPVRSLLRPLIRPMLRTPLQLGDQSIISRAMGILRSFGANASSFPFATLQGAYQTSAGPAAAAVNDPIGLELDAMGTRTDLTVSQDLTTWTSGGAFGNWSNSTATASTITAVGVLGSRYIRFACAPGNLVQFAANIVAGTTNGLVAAAFGTSGAVYISDSVDWPGFASGPSSISAIAPAGTAFVEIVIRAIDAGGTVGFTGLSATLTTGNHATQTTAINRPTVQRGLWNLLTYSQDLSNAAWDKSNVTVATGFADHLGGLSAASVTENTATSSHYVLQTAVSAPLASVVFILKANGRDRVKIRSESPALILSAIFDLSTGVVVSGTGSIISLGNGWYACSATSTAGTGASGYHLVQTLGAADAESYLGDGVSGIYVAGAGLFQGTLTADQILQQGGIPLTTSAAGSNPVAGPYWASFNGTNSSLQLASVPFQMADDFAVVACVNPGTQAGNGAIFASTDATATPRIELYIANATGFAAFYLHDDATGTSAASGATDIRNSPCVVTLWKVGNAKYLRVNSVQVATDSTALGTATFTGAAWGCLPVVFADYFNGGNYEGDAIKGTLTLAQVIALEKAAAQRAGLVL